jgi:hypothetical protein
MSLKSVTVNGTEYLLLHAGQPRVNGGKCNQYEVRTRDEQGNYQQLADIYVPLGRGVEEHLQLRFDADDEAA